MVAVPSALAGADDVPRLCIFGKDRGQLVEALARSGGAAFLELGTSPRERPPAPRYGQWRSLWHEATAQRRRFWERPAAAARLLAFNRGEDLRRTLEGEHKTHRADWRYNFGVTTGNALSRSAEEWDDLAWIAEDFRETLDFASRLMEQELLSPSPASAHGGSASGSSAARRAAGEEERPPTLLGKLRERSEGWGCSRFRHSVYPAGGACTEHTDYGVVTLQQSNAPGLEAELNGGWRHLEPPEGCVLVFAGDMLERLTNGRVKALKHRVCLEGEAASRGEEDVVRQCNIFFLQPDKATVVQPLRQYIREDNTDLSPVKYGDWHHLKTRLAFQRE